MMEFLQSIEQLSFSTWVREGGAIYGYPLILFTHTLCLAIVVGTVMIISLRLLGWFPTMPIKPLEKMLPLLKGAFLLNFITGVILIMADATVKLTNWDFYLKMVLVVAGIIVVLRFEKDVFGDPNIDKHPVTPRAKMLAVAGLVCWLGALTAGRLLAYLGPVAGLAN